MKNLNKSEIESLKESGYTFEEINHIDNSLGEKGGYSPEEAYFMILKNREKTLCIK